MTIVWSRAERPSPSFARGIAKDAIWSIFECGDGRWIHVPYTSPDRAPLMSEALEDLGPDGVAAANLEHPGDPRLPNFGANRVAFLRHDSATWMKDLADADIPAGVVEPLGAILTDPQARLNGYVVDIDDAVFGPTKQAGTTEPPPRVRGRAPVLGEHDDEEFSRTIGQPRHDDAPTTATRWPLEGLRVVDFGHHIAGPIATMLLADLGADVIKVEPPGGETMRSFAGAQRGKRGLVLDLRDRGSAETLAALLGWADVVHHNTRGGAASRVGIDADAVLAANPRVVHCHVNSYGPDGPSSELPGYDAVFEASCGWEHEGAGPGNPPLWYRFGMLDHYCGTASLVATLLGLYERNRTGRGQRVSASLLGAGVLTAGETLLLADGSVADYPRLDADQTGVAPDDRLYRVADGWIAVAPGTPTSADDPYRAMCQSLGVGSIGAVEQALRHITTASAIRSFDLHGVWAVAVVTSPMDDFFDDPTNRASSLSVAYDSAEYGRLEQVGRLWDFGSLGCRIERAAPAVGQHTDELLDELGVHHHDLPLTTDRSTR